MIEGLWLLPASVIFFYTIGVYELIVLKFTKDLEWSGSLIENRYGDDIIYSWTIYVRSKLPSNEWIGSHMIRQNQGKGPM